MVGKERQSLMEKCGSEKEMETFIPTSVDPKWDFF